MKKIAVLLFVLIGYVSSAHMMMNKFLEERDVCSEMYRAARTGDLDLCKGLRHTFGFAFDDNIEVDLFITIADTIQEKSYCKGMMEELGAYAKVLNYFLNGYQSSNEELCWLYERFAFKNRVKNNSKWYGYYYSDDAEGLTEDFKQVKKSKKYNKRSKSKRVSKNKRPCLKSLMGDEEDDSDWWGDQDELPVHWANKEITECINIFEKRYPIVTSHQCHDLSNRYQAREICRELDFAFSDEKESLLERHHELNESYDGELNSIDDSYSLGGTFYYSGDYVAGDSYALEESDSEEGSDSDDSSTWNEDYKELDTDWDKFCALEEQYKELIGKMSDYPSDRDISQLHQLAQDFHYRYGGEELEVVIDRLINTF